MAALPARGGGMISRLRGFVRDQRDNQILFEVNGVSYDILMPPSILKGLAERLDPGVELEIVTYHYQTIEVGRGVPILIGFLNEIEREFFTRFISVSGVGPRAAIKAFTLPIADIAQAIDDGDLTLLKSLPGVGEQRGKEIIAKLQGKVGKFGLMRSREGALLQPSEDRAAGFEQEAIAVLVQLEYKKSEAKQMVRSALERNPRASSAEELLNEVYRQQKATVQPAS